MKIKIDTSGMRQSKWYEYVVRFAFGGAVTALTGIVANRFGPEIGGLFLVFPAILPATASLIEKHEKEKKERAGLKGGRRGLKAAGVDAVGASMGAIGLVLFAVIVWLRLPRSSTAAVLTLATVAWLFASVLVWRVREMVWRSLKKRYRRRSIRPESSRATKSAVGMNERLDD